MPPPLVIPQPPADALAPCGIPAIVTGDAAGVETALIERGVAIARCEGKRRALAEAWPR